MAFTFVPNADGSFTEGDRQTNPDTGVEYIYVDGAWRALGADIANEFDTLDERYVNASGDTMTGDLQLEQKKIRFKKTDGSNQLRISPNSGDYYTNIYAYNSGGMRFRATPGDSNDNYGTGLIVEAGDHFVGEEALTTRTSILNLQTPTRDSHAANKWYVDDAVSSAIDAIPDVDLSSYLPLTGGRMTGGISFTSQGSATRSFLSFDNNEKANAVSEIVVKRPFNADGGANSDGTTNASGLGGLNIKIMANSDQNRLNIMTGSGASTNTLRITGGGNGKQIHSFSSIELCGGDSARQTIWAKSGVVGNLSYSGNSDSNVRLSWGNSKVWIKNADLDVTGHQIINVDEPSNTNHAATKNYVDTQIAANVSQGITVNTPPGIRFGFGNGTTAVGVGNFNYYSDGGQLKLRISLNGKDVKWYDGGKTQDYNYSATQLFSIYYVPDQAQPSRWSIVRHGQFKRIDWHANDVLVWVDNHLTNGSLNTAYDYFIVLGGIF